MTTYLPSFNVSVHAYKVKLLVFVLESMAADYGYLRIKGGRKSKVI